MKKIKLYFMILGIICFFIGCKQQVMDNDTITTTEFTTDIYTTTSSVTTTTEVTSEVVTTETTTHTETTENITYGIEDEVIVQGMAKDILSNMTLEEKIGQMLIVNFELLDDSKGKYYEHKKITEDMIESLNKYKVGGVIFFSRNIENIEQTKTFIEDLHINSKIPLFISVDEEGGTVSRIGSNTNMRTTPIPDMRDIGDAGDYQAAYEVGITIGKEIRELGFNLNFAPVADVVSKEGSSEMDRRSFGSKPKVVGDMVVEVVKGLQANGVSATLKHFIGLGMPMESANDNGVMINRTIAQLRKSDFVPFKEGIKAGVDLIMVTHAYNIGVTDNMEPTSMSKLMVTDILRTELGYRGIIITDIMNVKSLTDLYTPKKAVVDAVMAGVDILLMPEDLDKAYQAILNQVKQEKITEERIDESVLRILQVKLRRGIIKADTNLLNIQE